MKLFLKQTNAKNSRTGFYIARRIGIMPQWKKKKKSLISQGEGEYWYDVFPSVSLWYDILLSSANNN